ncbi:MAG: antibiotic biosynthesis monooxygenase [Candidatus Heimdallarchaeota archaeon]|nr:antibiotic biosynthesis monooxygenase [Candidatus Heimdallarchaeota archaeon]
MISRVWYGYTTHEKADKYESLLKKEIFIDIGKRKIEGVKGIHLFRRKLENEEEFITIMWFDSMNLVRSFAEEYETTVVPLKARKLLTRFNARSKHYDVKAKIEKGFSCS